MRPGSESPSKREAERQALFRDTLFVAKYFANQVGRNIPINPIDRADQISDEPGAYIFSEHSNKPIVDADFRLRQELLSGTQDSAHSVLAGVIEVQRDDEEEPKINEVAIKCFLKRNPGERISRAIQEFRVMEYLKGQEELTFEPICLVKGRDDDLSSGSVAIMTTFEPTVFSLDNYAWAKSNGDAEALAHSAAASLGRFNTLGIFHGDAKIKNVAQDETGKFGMIDYETSYFFDATSPSDASGTALTDFETLVKSLADRQFFNAPNRLPRRQAILENLAQSYLDQWISAPEPVQDSVYNAISLAVTRFKTLEWGIEDEPAA